MTQNQGTVSYAATHAKAQIEIEQLIAEMAAKLRQDVTAHGLYSNEVIHGSLALARIIAASKGIAPTETTK